MHTPGGCIPGELRGKKVHRPLLCDDYSLPFIVPLHRGLWGTLFFGSKLTPFYFERIALPSLEYHCIRIEEKFDTVGRSFSTFDRASCSNKSRRIEGTEEIYMSTSLELFLNCLYALSFANRRRIALILTAVSITLIYFEYNRVTIFKR